MAFSITYIKFIYGTASEPNNVIQPTPDHVRLASGSPLAGAADDGRSSRPQAVINKKPDFLQLWALHNRKLGVEVGGRQERARG